MASARTSETRTQRRRRRHREMRDLCAVLCHGGPKYNRSDLLAGRLLLDLPVMKPLASLEEDTLAIKRKSATHMTFSNDLHQYVAIDVLPNAPASFIIHDATYSLDVGIVTDSVTNYSLPTVEEEAQLDETIAEAQLQAFERRRGSSGTSVKKVVLEQQCQAVRRVQRFWKKCKPAVFRESIAKSVPEVAPSGEPHSPVEDSYIEDLKNNVMRSEVGELFSSTLAAIRLHDQRKPALEEVRDTKGR